MNCSHTIAINRPSVYYKVELIGWALFEILIQTELNSNPSKVNLHNLVVNKFLTMILGTFFKDVPRTASSELVPAPSPLAIHHKPPATIQRFKTFRQERTFLRDFSGVATSGDSLCIEEPHRQGLTSGRLPSKVH